MLLLHYLESIYITLENIHGILVTLFISDYQGSNGQVLSLREDSALWRKFPIPAAAPTLSCRGSPQVLGGAVRQSLFCHALSASAPCDFGSPYWK